ncbi:hypothetical protein Ocin01_17248 [Orchesella cincta]|uniref:Uncharacterized protein n=1 Tax=Orchesella cincta TaxID=48709 RepID=A0A1D2M949_ORCCI|nr:hypothetical protein Ocin01_17248 [Orchesella cincta]
MPLGCLDEVQGNVDRLQKSIVINHIWIILVGCSCLMIQYFADPKYCTFTYSLLKSDNQFLRIVFGAHEFLFMLLAWNAYAASCSLCILQGITLSNTITKMTSQLNTLFSKTEIKLEKVKAVSFAEPFTVSKKVRFSQRKSDDNVEMLLLDYKQLMIVCNQLNGWIAYKTLFLHVCGGCQFVSDVFAATHILKLPGTGFMDVW